jgi:hypothetical protein
MITKNILFQAGLTCLIFGLTACGTTTTGVSSSTGTAAATTGSTGATASAMIEAALPLIRTRLANEMYAAANAVYSLSGGAFPAPAQFESSILAFGGSQADANYAQFSTAIAGLYAAYYPKLVTGDTKTATDLLNAIAGGIEDATASYMTTPVATVESLVPKFHLGMSLVLREIPFRADITGCNRVGIGNGIAPTIAFPNGVWERGNFAAETLSF